MVKTESNVEKSIMKTIVKNNGFVIKNQASPTTGKGRPDLTACIQGRYVAIEVKKNSDNSKTNVSQFNKLRAIAKAGGIALYVSNDKDFAALYPTLFTSIEQMQPITITAESSTEFIKQLKRLLHSHTILQVLPNGSLICRT